MRRAGALYLALKHEGGELSRRTGPLEGVWQTLHREASTPSAPLDGSAPGASKGEAGPREDRCSHSSALNLRVSAHDSEGIARVERTLTKNNDWKENNMGAFTEGELLELVGQLEAELQSERSLRLQAEAETGDEAARAAQEAAEAERRQRIEVGPDATRGERKDAFAELLRQKREDAAGADNGLPWRYQRQASPWR